MPTRELTARGLVLGALITIVFTAANVYLGLKVGLTFASSIPAAVISMAVLKVVGGATILENNAVQTQASAAGTLSSIIFVIPGLVMVGHWHGFPYLETAGICAAGGILGVVFTIPLRRALVVESALPFPEGVAAAEILRLGGETASEGARALATGGIVSGAFNLCTAGFGLLADNLTTTLTAGHALFRLQTGFSLALVGAGYLMGIAAGAAILLGIVTAWLVAVPILTAITPRPPGVADTAFALGLWSHQVRFIGAGTIAVAAVWTLATLTPAIGRGLAASFATLHGPAGSPGLDRTERDLGGRTILILTGLAIVGLYLIFAHFLGIAAVGLAVFGTVFAAAFGFLVAAACGYMAGIVGSSASPISGIAIVAVSLSSLALLAMPAGATAIAIPLALFITSAVIAIATISNDNLQDLKTGRLVGATPARQQWALIVGSLVGAAVIPPILDLLYRAYGFTGALPHAGMDPAKALAAPQATLMSAIADGILGHSLDWTMISIGLGFGVLLIVVDVMLRQRTRALRLPVLATGIGLYLPATVSFTLVTGALISWITDRLLAGRNGAAERHGMLVASGFIVGESLVGVVLAAIIGAAGRQDAVALVGPGFAGAATILGTFVFVVVCIGFAWSILRQGRGSAPSPAKGQSPFGNHQ